MIPSNDQIRALWRKAGGEFHGPNIETGTMPEAQLLVFLRGLLIAGQAMNCGNCPGDRFAHEADCGAPDCMADAYGVRNDQGYWVGAWKTRETAEHIRGKGIHGEKVYALAIIGGPDA